MSEQLWLRALAKVRTATTLTAVLTTSAAIPAMAATLDVVERGKPRALPNAKTPIAVIGAGAIGRTHIDLIRSNTRCRLAAIVDPTPVAQRLARGLEVPYFSELDDRLLGADVRGAILATPTQWHTEHATTCLRLGIPILLEKPMASTLAEAVRLCGNWSIFLI